jgi:hypothetical protein
MNGLRTTFAAGVAAALACTASATLATQAHADEEKERGKGLAIGVRVAYADALGSVDSHQDLHALQRTAIPFWFDLGWRFNPKWFLGVFYQYMPTIPPAHCLGDTVNGEPTCDGNDQRFGIELAYHILPHKLVDPWIGLGVGYEFMRLNSANGTGGDSQSFLANGMQIFDVQVGADLRFVPRIPFGPFLDMSLGQYFKESSLDANGNSTALNFSPALHEWFSLGVKAQFNL